MSIIDYIMVFVISLCISLIATYSILMFRYGHYESNLKKFRDNVASSLNDITKQTRANIVFFFVDIFAAWLAIPLLSPIMLSVIVIKIILRSRIFCIRKYTDIFGRNYMFMKFDVNRNTNRKIERFNSFLRRTSISELPLLFSVGVGKCGFFGITAISDKFLSESGRIVISQNMDNAHYLKPGIASIMSIIACNEFEYTYENILRADMYFIAHDSILFRVKMMQYVVLSAFTKPLR